MVAGWASAYPDPPSYRPWMTIIKAMIHGQLPSLCFHWRPAA
jgi:hypothetical protein